MTKEQNHNSNSSKYIKHLKHGGISILLFYIDNEIFPPKQGIRNLFSLNESNEVIWVADLPIDYPHGYYMDIEIVANKLYGWCGSIRYEIDIDTGGIVSAMLFK